MYDVNYFIKRFEAIPENLWLINRLNDDNHIGAHCANGHLGVQYPTKPTEESKGLYIIMEPLKLYYTDCLNYEVEEVRDFTVGYSTKIAAINNGKVKEYRQDTPKQRVLAALKDIKRIEDNKKLAEVDKMIEGIKEPVKQELLCTR